MKSKTLIIGLVILVLFVIVVSVFSQQGGGLGERFKLFSLDKTYEYSFSHNIKLYILIDQHTLVEYLVVDKPAGIGICKLEKAN